MIIYTENPKDTTKKPLEMNNKYSKVVEYKINIQKSVAFLNTDKKRNKETITFTIIKKIPRNKFNQGSERPKHKTIRHVKRKWRRHREMER